MKGWAPPGEPEDASGCTAWPPATEHLSCGMAPLGRGVARASWDAEFVAVQASAGWLSRSGPPLAPMREGTRLRRVSLVPAGGPPGSGGPRGCTRASGTPAPSQHASPQRSAVQHKLGADLDLPPKNFRNFLPSAKKTRSKPPSLSQPWGREGPPRPGVGSALRPHSLPPTSPRGARASSVLAPSPPLPCCPPASCRAGGFPHILQIKLGQRVGGHAGRPPLPIGEIVLAGHPPSLWKNTSSNCKLISNLRLHPWKFYG